MREHPNVSIIPVIFFPLCLSMFLAVLPVTWVILICSILVTVQWSKNSKKCTYVNNMFPTVLNFQYTNVPLLSSFHCLAVFWFLYSFLISSFNSNFIYFFDTIIWHTSYLWIVDTVLGDITCQKAEYVQKIQKKTSNQLV